MWICLSTTGPRRGQSLGDCALFQDAFQDFKISHYRVLFKINNWPPYEILGTKFEIDGADDSGAFPGRLQ